MNVCRRLECQTTAGCAHRGPQGELCWFSADNQPGKYPGWFQEAKPLNAWSDKEIEAEYHRRKLAAVTVMTPEESDEIDKRIAALEKHVKSRCPVPGCGFREGVSYAGSYPCQRSWGGDPEMHSASLAGCRLVGHGSAQ